VLKNGAQMNFLLSASPQSLDFEKQKPSRSLFHPAGHSFQKLNPTMKYPG
jgi:hypothetical protein